MINDNDKHTVNKNVTPLQNYAVWTRIMSSRTHAIISDMQQRNSICEREALVKFTFMDITANHKRWTNSKVCAHPSRHAEMTAPKHFWLLGIKQIKGLKSVKDVCIPRQHSTSNLWHQGPTVLNALIHSNEHETTRDVLGGKLYTCH